MTDIQITIRRTVTKSQEIFLDVLPFGMDKYDVDNYSEVQYIEGMGECVTIDLDTRDFEEKLEMYKKDLPTENLQTMFADEHCLIRVRIASSGTRYYEMLIPLQDSWDDLWEDEEETEVEIY